jgi:drug/metabolite transporter (DMT)-like permease
MDLWIIYGLIAAVLIASRDIFTKQFSKKYNTTEHLLYYYILCGFFIGIYAIYKKVILKERVNLIHQEDLWKYGIVAAISVIIISPCQVLSIKESPNPGKAKAIVNLNTLFLFFMSLYFIKSEKITLKKIIGIIATVGGIYLVM